jgi:hypothetical protein
MREHNCSLKEAYLQIKSKRKIVGPHQYLKRQLIEYEIFHRKEATFNIKEWELFASAIERGHSIEHLKKDTKLISD